jgi:glycerate kinase
LETITTPEFACTSLVSYVAVRCALHRDLERPVVHVLVAPDKFKGSLSSAAVADAMAVGARRALRDPTVVTRPLADGGEGTVEALVEALGGELRTERVAGPLGDPVEAGFALLEDGRGAIEVAAACGLWLVAEHPDALRATSRGAGDLIAAALGAGTEAIIVGVGGTASTDGGTGAARALGWRFLDAAGRELSPGGAALSQLARIDSRGVDPRLTGVRLRGACDVGNELLGPDGAARVFGPQKGARSPHQVELLEAGLERLAQRIEDDLGVAVAGRWGAGAGGGLGAGLVAFFGAELGPGFALIAEAVRLKDEIARADVVVTGEGRLDAQSAGGKVPVGVARMAVDAGTRCVAVAGEIELDAEGLGRSGFAAAASLVQEVGRRRALSDPAGALAVVTERLLRRAYGSEREH